MDTALRLLPGRRQVPGLTDTTVDSMPPYDPAWDPEPISEKPEIQRGEANDAHATAISHHTPAVNSRRLPPESRESLQENHLSRVQRATIATCCRQMGWPDYHTPTAQIARTMHQGPDRLSWRQIGLIFGVSRSTPESHVSGEDWTAEPFG
jgi:hypothetical protein